MMTLDDLRDRWLKEEPIYTAFAEKVADVLGLQTRKSGITCRVEFRSKDVGSLIKKQIRYGFPDPWSEIRDKAGVRLVVPYQDLIEATEEIVKAQFRAISVEGRDQALKPTQLGYSGIHYHVQPLEGSDLVNEFGALEAEVQIHTQAHALWATVSHQLMYKASVQLPPDVVRAVYLAQGLLEFADMQFISARKATRDAPGSEVIRLLDDLVNFYYRFSTRQFDSELSQSIISGLKQAMPADRFEAMVRGLAGFVSTHQNKIAGIFENYSRDPRGPHLLFQPETLLVFECLDSDAYRFRNEWHEVLPDELLGELATVWGKPLPDLD